MARRGFGSDRKRGGNQGFPLSRYVGQLFCYGSVDTGGRSKQNPYNLVYKASRNKDEVGYDPNGWKQKQGSR